MVFLPQGDERRITERLHRALTLAPPPPNLWYAVQVPVNKAGEFTEVHRLMTASGLYEPGLVRDWWMDFGRALGL